MEYISKKEDVKSLVQKLNVEMWPYISINVFDELFTGKYINSSERNAKGVDFSLLYSKDEFLRLSVGNLMEYRNYEQKIQAINAIRDAICKLLGEEPVVFYNTTENGSKVPHYDWAFVNKQEYIEDLKNGYISDFKVEKLKVYIGKTKTMKRY